MKSIEERIKDAEAEVARLKEEQLRSQVYAGARFQSGNTVYTIIHVNGLKCWWKTSTQQGICPCSIFMTDSHTKLSDAK